MEKIKPMVVPTCEKEVFDKVLFESDNAFAVGIAEMSITYAQEAQIDIALPKEDPNEPDMPNFETLRISAIIDNCGDLSNYVFSLDTPDETRWTFDDESEILALIADFKSRLTATQIEAQKPKVKAKPQPKPKVEKKPNETPYTYRKWTDEEKAEIIRRYQAGEGPKAIADSLGVNRNKIQQIIHAAGVTKGRLGGRPKREPEPQPEADDKEPVCVMEATKPIPSAAEIEAAEKQRRKDLQEYRKNHKKAWYM